MVHDDNEELGDAHGVTVNVLLGYGGKEDVVKMSRALAKQVAAGLLDPDDIDYEVVKQHLGVSDSPDLIVRTGGEMRLSNFLLVQCAYSEFHVSNKLWPQFEKEDFMAAMDDYASRRKLAGK